MTETESFLKIACTGVAAAVALNSASVGQAVVVLDSVATSYFGLTLGATVAIGIGIAVVGIIAICGVTYWIIKKRKQNAKCSSPNQLNSSPNQLNSSPNQLNSSPNQLNSSPNQSNTQTQKQFKMPKLPQHDKVSNFSDAFTISKKQVESIEKAYSCGISYTLMKEPVLALCCKKRNYERVVIEAWIDQKGKCPYCNKDITRKDLIPNQALEQGIKIFRKQLAKRARKMEQKRIEEDILD